MDPSGNTSDEGGHMEQWVAKIWLLKALTIHTENWITGVRIRENNYDNGEVKVLVGWVKLLRIVIAAVCVGGEVAMRSNADDQKGSNLGGSEKNDILTPVLTLSTC